MGAPLSEAFADTKFRNVAVCLTLALLLFAGLKVVLNTDAFGTDAVKTVPSNQLRNVRTDLAAVFPFNVFGDLIDGMYPAAKVYENGERLGESVNWSRDLREQGAGRTFHFGHMVMFSAPDNTNPVTNGRSYSVAYNPLAWLNLDWLSLAVLAAAWLVLGLVRDNEHTDALRRSPGLWLVLFLLDRFATLASSPNFVLSTVADSNSYISLAKYLGSPEVMFKAFRTGGYPLFYALTPDVLIPTVQLGLFFCAVYVLFAGLRRISGNGWVPLLACLPMATLNNTYRLDALAYSHLLIPDSLALTMGLFAVGTAFLFFGDDRRPRLWLVLCGLATLFAYQLKPSYLFLAVCLPGLGLGWIALCRRGQWKDCLRRQVLPLSLVVLLPLLAFCGFRLAVVGQFGLVSAGGRQLVGLAGNFLDTETARQVSPELHPMALEVAQIIREKKALAPVTSDGERLYRHIFRTYDWIIYGNGELKRLCSGIECDVELGRLSREVLALHPGPYLTWLRAAAADASGRVVEFGRWKAVILWGLGGALAFFLVALVRVGKTVSLRDDVAGVLLACDVKMLAWAFLCLFLTSLLVVILVAIPYSRYLLPTRILFMPFCLCLAGALVRGGVRLWKRVPPSVGKAGK